MDRLDAAMDRLDAAVERARGLVEIARYEQARDVLSGVLATQPDHFAALCLVSRVYVHLGEPARALAAAEAAAAVEADRASPHLLRTAALLELRRRRAAVRAAGQAVRLEPGNSRAHAARAYALSACQRRLAAWKAAARAVELDPYDTFAREALGHALARVGRRRSARRQYSRALELDPESASARKGLASVAIDAGKLAEGARHALAVLSVNPHDAEARAEFDRVAALAFRLSAISLCAALVLMALSAVTQEPGSYDLRFRLLMVLFVAGGQAICAVLVWRTGAWRQVLQALGSRRFRRRRILLATFIVTWVVAVVSPYSVARFVLALVLFLLSSAVTLAPFVLLIRVAFWARRRFALRRTLPFRTGPGRTR